MISGAGAWWKLLPLAQRRMVPTLAAAVALANVAQPFPDLAPLQHGPTVALLLAAPFLLTRWPLPTSGVTCIWLFLLLHTLGARWIYSYVPYDDWARGLFGHDISSLFGATRNFYDRLVHFAFGALLTLPITQSAHRHGTLSPSWSLAFAFAAIGFGSALYEIFEWLLTILAAGDTADYYNGQQGDIWDAQKDMAVAQIGSTLAVIALLRRQARRHIGGTSRPNKEAS